MSNAKPRSTLYSLSFVRNTLPWPMTAAPGETFSHLLTARLVEAVTPYPGVDGQTISFVVDSDNPNAPQVRNPQDATGSQTWRRSVSVVTDNGGLAAVQVRAGPIAGNFSVLARNSAAENTPSAPLVVQGNPLPNVDHLTVIEGDQQTGFVDDEFFPKAVRIKASNASGTAIDQALIDLEIQGDTDTTFESNASARVTLTTYTDGITPAARLVPGKRPGMFAIVATCRTTNSQCSPARLDLALAPAADTFAFENKPPFTITRGTCLTDTIRLIGSGDSAWPYIPVRAVVDEGFPDTFYLQDAANQSRSIILHPADTPLFPYSVPLYAVDTNVVVPDTGSLRLMMEGHPEIAKAYALTWLPHR
ncbi:hypothetical protein [Paludibacterium purpuratum]|uniref:Uncharacterized protein n=1 Tax=Paludibacterium purpuratum TaxID=1144873 RepID=A0A4R7B2C4_9NEIS|nr:hypothetical protein [Paludibacterium purpuratum]TDR73908.1 hypothetical protein DFP86_112112 [Paludibacterium purpuratum]